MPLYEFQCPRCGQEKEEFLKLNDTEMPVCDRCGEQMTKTMSAPAFILKGNGWYKDHYGLKEQKKKSSKEKTDVQ